MADKEVTLSALGRIASLGQLYSVATGKFIEQPLFPTESLLEARVVESMPKTEIEFKEVRSTNERAHVLNVSASISVAVMAGALKLEGAGSYLDRANSEEDTTTIFGMARARTVHTRLDLSNQRLLSTVALKPEELKDSKATHVVTAITFGATMLGVFTSSRSHKYENREVKGKFSLSTLQSIGKLAGAKGSAEVTDQDKEEVKKHNVIVKFAYDYVDPELVLPQPDDPAGMIQAIERGFPKISSAIDAEPSMHGVPIEFTLTPITRFDQFSTQLEFQELAEADLKRIMAFYDDFITLRQRWNMLNNAMDRPSQSSTAHKYSQLFPSHKASCANQGKIVSSQLTSARNALGTFLRNYRTLEDKSATVSSFLGGFIPIYEQAVVEYEKHWAQWEMFLCVDSMAKQFEFPLATSSTIKSSISGIGSNTRTAIIVLVVPPTVNFLTLLNSYRGWGDDIKAWRKSSEQQDQPETIYCTYIADPAGDKSMIAVEEKPKVVPAALARCRETLTPAFLKYGALSQRSRVIRWTTLNEDGWGTLIDEQRKTRYIGEIKAGLPHGRGIMRYCDGTVYDGTWIAGLRDGVGRISLHRVLYDDGPFYENQPSFEIKTLGWKDPDTAGRFYHDVIEVLVYDAQDNFSSSAIFAVKREHPPVSQVRKIASVFNWAEGERYRLTPTYQDPSDQITKELPYWVIANGTALEQTLEPVPLVNNEPSWWPNGSIDVNGVWKHILTYDGYSTRVDDATVPVAFKPLVVKAQRL